MSPVPFRLDPERFPFRAKIQFTTSASMPHRIYKACVATDTVSNTRYCQEALCEKLSRDLDIPLEDLLAELPAPRGPAGHLYDPDEGTMRRTRPVHEDPSGGVVRTGPANTYEDVR
jgi:hypothetical protein